MNPIFRCAYIVAFLMPVLDAAGQDPGPSNCAACEESVSLFLTPAEVLENNGLAPAQYTIATEWNEMPRDGSKLLIQGIHLIPKDGSPAFDLYADEDGLIFSNEELQSLGVSRKEWGASSVSVDGELPFAKAIRAAVKTSAPKMAATLQSVPVVSLSPIDLAAVEQEDLLSEAQSKGDIWP